MNERHTKILDLLTKYKKVEVSKLSQLLGVSQVTIRKDLDHLENTGILIREHGYAKLNESDDINNRLAYRYDIKQKIASYGATMVNDGETIMMPREIDIQCHPKGLNVFVPTKSSERANIFSTIGTGFWDFVNSIRTELNI